MVTVSVIGGSGDLGFGLATRFGAAGIPVTVGSRNEQRAAATADALRERVPAGAFRGADNASAVAGATVIILTVPFASQLTDLAHRFEQDVLVCGDSRADRRVVAELLQRIPGFRCVDCGPLEMSRFSEQLTPLLIGLNHRYRAKSGVRIVGLPETLWA